MLTHFAPAFILCGAQGLVSALQLGVVPVLVQEQVGQAAAPAYIAIAIALGGILALRWAARCVPASVGSHSLPLLLTFLGPTLL